MAGRQRCEWKGRHDDGPWVVQTATWPPPPLTTLLHRCHPSWERRWADGMTGVCYWLASGAGDHGVPSQMAAAVRALFVGSAGAAAGEQVHSDRGTATDNSYTAGRHPRPGTHGRQPVVWSPARNGAAAASTVVPPTPPSDTLTAAATLMGGDTTLPTGGVRPDSATRSSNK